MAHNIATINGKAAMAYDVETPWHGLGIKLGASASVDMALDAAQLRYLVGSIPMYLADGTEIKGHKASVRFAADGSTAAVFAPVGDGYQHVQNEAASGILRDLGWPVAAAGALGDGERCWMLARMADDPIKVLGTDEVRGYFLLHWSHDGNSGVVGQFTGIRVVCQNTLAMAESAGRGRKGNTFNIRHTSSADSRVAQAATIMQQLSAALAKTGETFDAMARRPLGPAAVQHYIDVCVPNPEPKKTLSPVLQARRDAIAQLLTAGKGADMANQGVDAGSVSLWGAYNAVTEYFDHVRTAETKSPEGLLRAQESAIFGGNAEAKAYALNVAQQLLAV